MILNNEVEVELLTIKEAAALLKISVSSVRRLQQERYIPFIKVGGSVRFYRNDIMDYLQKRRVDALR